jgi:hypothetical protein
MVIDQAVLMAAVTAASWPFALVLFLTFRRCTPGTLVCAGLFVLASSARVLGDGARPALDGPT